MISKILSAFDFSDKEIKIFEKLLEFGIQPASQIARLTELPRNTVRDVLDRLTKRGFLIRTQHANAHYYGVEKVESIVFHLKKERTTFNDQYEHQIDILKNFGSELVPNTQRGNRPQITFYDGTEGLEKVYEDTLTSRTDILAYACLETMYDSGLKDYFPKYFKRRAAKKIFIRAIFPDSKEARERVKKDKEELRESVIVPKNMLDISPEINIYDGKVIFVSWEEKIAIQIRSDEIYKAMKIVFDLAWKAAKMMKSGKK
ncbi:MAG: Transcriptional regulator, TrmB [Candidatus Peregrinibacteria bacterium GW2011_GWC2_39_14]|nr:MAG: Transcriptional regulator, TrmB [Candidatus Peregrinibacteria bacterium GW2011_GWA2_38_36]KKR07219.1 MAG: Transcriptional regulator, TrmB [Candidatus Peregrinibacteria bacterium GW2011_GWC2_39_14]